MIRNKHRNFRQEEMLPESLPENVVQDSVLDYLESMGFLAIRVNSGSFKQKHGGFFRAYIIHNFLIKFTKKNKKDGPQASSGFPDVLALRGNNFFLFEIKAGSGGIISKSQKDFIELANIKHIQVYVIDNKDQVRNIIEAYYNG